MAAEVRRVAAKGCHAVTFSENPSKLGLAELPLRPLGPVLDGVRGGGDGRVPAHRLVVAAGHHRARRPLRRAHRPAAGEHRPVRRRPAVVAGAAQVPRPAHRAVRGRHRVDPVLPRARRLRLPAPPQVDGPGLRRHAAEPGVPGAHRHVLHRRRLRRGEPPLPRARQRVLGVRLPPLRLDVAQRPRDRHEVPGRGARRRHQQDHPRERHAPVPLRPLRAPAPGEVHGGGPAGRVGRRRHLDPAPPRHRRTQEDPGGGPGPLRREATEPTSGERADADARTANARSGGRSVHAGSRSSTGDGHVMEPPDLWSSRMDAKKWGDWIPHVDPANGKRYVGGEVRNGGVDALHRASELSGIPVERIAENVKRVGASLMRKGGWDPATRLEDMDRAGIDAVGALPERRHVLRARRPHQGAAQQRVRPRLPARPTTSGWRSSAARTATGSSAWGSSPCRTSAWPWPRPSTPWSSACAASSSARRAYIDELPLSPQRLRPVLVGVPGARAPGGLPPRRAHRHARRVPEVRPRASTTPTSRS